MNLRTMRIAAIVAASASVAGLALAADQTPLPLAYNFNGMIHAGEAGWPDNPDGFRSISDRAIVADGAPGSFNAGAVVGSTGLTYSVVGNPFTLDIVHLGNRLISNAYDLEEDGDNIGVQPNWDTSPDHTVPQVSDVSSLALEMFGNTQIGVLYQISNSGGQFDMTLTFTDASSITVRLAGPDWFGAPAVPAPLAGVLSQSRLGGASAVWNSTNSNDLGNPAPLGERLSLIEAIVSVQDLINDGFGDVTGKVLSSITFGNATYPVNFGRGYAIIAATARGAEHYGPEGVGSVTPSPVVSGQSATFSVTVTPGSGSPNHITSVVVDGTTLELSDIDLNDNAENGDLVAGDNIWSATVNVPGSALAGPRNIPFIITDAQARTGGAGIAFNVVGPPVTIDLGTLADGLTNIQADLTPGQVVWYRFDLPESVDAIDLEYLNIDTEDSALSGNNDTEIGLYNSLGNLVGTDDDDGTNFLSQLTYGSTIPLPPPGNGLPYNGRDGATLAAGTYYLAVSSFNAIFNATNWNVTTTHASSGTLNINISKGSFTPGSIPTEFADMGVLSDGNPVSSTQQLDAGGVQWFRFELATGIDGSTTVREFLDIDTEGSGIADTIICLYRDDGNGSVVSIDNDDGSGLLSQLTYGRGSRLAVGDGLAYNGRDGASLAAGVYYLAVTETPASFGPSFTVVFNTGVNSGPVTVNLHRGVQPAYIAGPIHNPANGSDYYLLERGFTFTQAEALAVNLGGHLASIQDADENEFVRASVLGFDGTDRRAWIGFTDEASEGNFVWTDGSDVTYLNWANGEPNNAGNTEHYAEMLGSNGQWNDLTVNGVSGGGDWAVVEIVGGGPQFCDADWCQDGAVGVPDIFCFLSAWFSMDPEARCYGGTCDVPAIFAFLSTWFATGQGPCTP